MEPPAPRPRWSLPPVLATAVFVWVAWLVLMARQDAWHLFQDNWFMSVTRVFGSFIAGATSEGGGAVAFPVMTLAFDIAPHVARDFALMIQSVGMIAAAVTIALSGIAIERRAVVFAGLGGAVGMLIGLELIAPRLSPPFVKMFFTSFWLSFALALYWTNRRRHRQVLPRIADYRPQHAAVLFAVGVLGGVISGLTGSGLDILTFSLLVLAFRISEKIATPTSVVLMGGNALVGFLYKWTLASQPLAAEAWNYWYVCVPIVVVGAPVGARFIATRSRLFIAGFLYLSIGVQFVAALLLVPQTGPLLLFCAATIVGGGLLFRTMDRVGARRLAASEVDRPGRREPPVR